MNPITILKDKKEVKIEINTKIYNYEDILMSIEDFKEYNWTYIEGDPKEKIFVFLKPKSDAKNEELEILGSEFYNYVLGMSKNEE